MKRIAMICLFLAPAAPVFAQAIAQGRPVVRSGVFPAGALAEIVSPLNVATATAAFAQTWSATRSVDAWNSRRVAAVCLGTAPCPLPRPSIAALPWQKQGKAFAYVSTAVGVAFTSYMAGQMRHSQRGWVRKLSPLPQTLIIAASAYATQHNIRNRRVPPVPVLSFSW